VKKQLTVVLVCLLVSPPPSPAAAGLVR